MKLASLLCKPGLFLHSFSPYKSMDYTGIPVCPRLTQRTDSQLSDDAANELQKLGGVTVSPSDNE